MTKHRIIGWAGLCLIASGAGVAAQQGAGFAYGIEFEIGVDSVVRSDLAAAELTDAYLSADAALEFALAGGVTAFMGLTLESVTAPVADRAFGDLGLYVGEIGLAFELGASTVSAGKISPAFGSAWDSAPGFYAAAYAEDYEPGEMIGVTARTELGGGVLTMSGFYADNTILSDSWGTSRGRNTTATGGAGNTGRLNNFALQYDLELGETTFHAGLRHLARGPGDARDERGLSLGVTHAVSEDLSLMAEIAGFSGFGGGADNARYATLGFSYTQGPITYHAAYARRDITSTGLDKLVALGLDYQLENGVTLTVGLGFANAGGVRSRLVGAALLIPLGGE